MNFYAIYAPCVPILLLLVKSAYCDKDWPTPRLDPKLVEQDKKKDGADTAETVKEASGDDHFKLHCNRYEGITEMSWRVKKREKGGPDKMDDFQIKCKKIDKLEEVLITRKYVDAKLKTRSGVYAIDEQNIQRCRWTKPMKINALSVYSEADRKRKLYNQYAKFKCSKSPGTPYPEIMTGIARVSEIEGGEYSFCCCSLPRYRLSSCKQALNQVTPLRPIVFKAPAQGTTAFMVSAEKSYNRLVFTYCNVLPP